HCRKVIGEFLLSVLTANKTRNILQWSRTVKSVHRNEVRKNRRRELPHVVLHPRGLVLENANRFTSLEKHKSRLVIYVNVVWVKVNPLCVFNQFNGILY